MNKSIIYIKSNSVICNNIEYAHEELRTNKKLNDKRIFFILEQDLYIKKMDFQKNQSVNNLIMSEFGENEDYLFHYKILKDKKSVVVYAIKGGDAVLFLCDGAKSIKVIPIQIYIADSIKKLIKDKSWKVITEFKESYYFIFYKDKYIKCAYVEKNIDNLIERIKENNYLNNLYLDNNINYGKLEKKDITNISLGEILNEKRAWKQRFYTL